MTYKGGEMHAGEERKKVLSPSAESKNMFAKRISEVDRMYYLDRLKELRGRFDLHKATQIAIALGLSEDDVRILELMEQGDN